MDDAQSLSHFGVKGMKWGRRKAVKKTGTTQLGNHSKNKDRISFMSDKELERRIHRLSQERRLRELESNTKPKSPYAFSNLLKREGNTKLAKIAISSLTVAAASGLAGEKLSVSKLLKEVK